jgi:hypothetical protein
VNIFVLLRAIPNWRGKVGNGIRHKISNSSCIFNMLTITIDHFSELLCIKLGNTTSIHLKLTASFEHSKDFSKWGPYYDITELEFSSRSGKGATFFQTLPLIFPNVRSFKFVKSPFSTKHRSKIENIILCFQKLNTYNGILLPINIQERESIIESLNRLDFFPETLPFGETRPN